MTPSTLREQVIAAGKDGWLNGKNDRNIPADVAIYAASTALRALVQELEVHAPPNPVHDDEYRRGQCRGYADARRTAEKMLKELEDGQ